MAQQTKKAASKVTSKKNTSKWQKLVPRTPRAKFLTFLVVFAIMGGSVMAYRSFASTDTVLFMSDRLTTTGSGAVRITESSGSKKGAQVIVLRRGDAAKVTNPIALWTPYVSACANIRSYGMGIAEVQVYSNDLSERATRQSVIYGANSYARVCTDYMRHVNASQPVGARVVNVGGSGAGDIVVGSISIYYNPGGK